MGNLFLKIKYYRARFIEFIKHDYQYLKFPFVVVSSVVVLFLFALNKNYKAFNLVSSVYRTGWFGSFTLGVFLSRLILMDRNRLDDLINCAIINLQPTPNTEKFFNDPLRMIDGIITVLKSPSHNEKGAIIINYSYYFLLFVKFYDVEKLIEKYIVILEPSWAGLCEIGIIAYAKFNTPVYVMCYEKRDLKYLKALNSSFVPLEVGPSWFVNHNKFNSVEKVRDIDIIMVASWAKFKRHDAFFKALSGILKFKNNINIVLVGYPVDLALSDIKSFVELNGLKRFVSYKEWVSHEEVADLLNRSKISVLWSKFEGNNRAIIESMLCDTVVILREGHNYGEKYDFINEQTGVYANEKNLVNVILSILEGLDTYNPRDYVLNHRTCTLATNIMNKVISANEISSGRYWKNNLVVKVNELHSMDYFSPDERTRFSKDYEEIKKYANTL